MDSSDDVILMSELEGERRATSDDAGPTDRPWVPLLLWVSAAITALFYQGPGQNVIVLVYAMAFLLLALLLAFRHALRDRAWWAQYRVALALLAGYAALLIVIVQASRLPEVSFLELWDRLALPASVAIWLWLIQRLGIARAVAYWLIPICALIPALAGVLEFAATLRRSDGILLDANNLASMCNLGGFCLLAWVLVGWRDRAGSETHSISVARPAALPAVLPLWLVGIWLAVVMLALFATFSRTGILLWFAGLLLLWPVARRCSGMTPWSAVAALSVFFLLVTSALSDDASSGRYLETADWVSGGSVRIALWDSTVQLIGQAPWLGHGLGMFRLLYPGVRSVLEQDTAGNSPHNDYLLILFEGGLLLGVFCLVLLVALGWVMLKRLRASMAGEVSTEQVLQAGLVIGLGCVLAQAGVNFVLSVLPLVLPLAVAIALVLARDEVASRAATDERPFSHQTKAPVPVAPKRTQRMVVVAVALSSFSAWGYLALDGVAYAILVPQSGLPFSQNIRADDRALLQTALTIERLNPERGLPPHVQGGYFSNIAAHQPEADAKQHWMGLATSAFERSLENNPFNPQTYVWFADLSAATPGPGGVGQHDLALALLQRALALDPTELPVQARLVALYERQGDGATAHQARIEHIVPWLPLNIRRYPERALAHTLALRAGLSRYGHGPNSKQLDQFEQRARHVLAMQQD